MFECMPNFDMLQLDKTNHLVHLLMEEQRLQFILFPQHIARKQTQTQTQTHYLPTPFEKQRPLGKDVLELLWTG
ncbi:hypothetical protein L211DRAFT_837385 [Terfezia boudieri ATCC MYA-4762]|uniref:Uncharacterized protein n=1 Tax=Terfezia boudieri ATCC MYA-4762 TaxID=1051890 RepID=A0A3N4LNH7_9PEZI|nr:hypothetical protein L211DRAFT_837385 [Terfezia boudieri ATCC MYA-4762]